MEIVLGSLAVIALILGGMLLLARTWPPSSERTGYRLEHREDEPVTPEDDDSEWQVNDRHDTL